LTRERLGDGKMRGRYVTSTVAMLAAGLLLLLPVAGAPAKAPAIAKLLPASNELKGWAAIANTDTHCASSKELHKIYNGGDGEYIKAGVTEAYQRTYKNGTVLATVQVWRTKTLGKQLKSEHLLASGEVAGDCREAFAVEALQPLGDDTKSLIPACGLKLAVAPDIGPVEPLRAQAIPHVA